MKHIAPQSEIHWPDPEPFRLESAKEVDADNPKSDSPKSSVRSGDWFGCGRTITQDSWDGFIAAHKAYWDKKDKQRPIEKG